MSPQGPQQPLWKGEYKVCYLGALRLSYSPSTFWLASCLSLYPLIHSPNVGQIDSVKANSHHVTTLMKFFPPIWIQSETQTTQHDIKGSLWHCSNAFPALLLQFLLGLNWAEQAKSIFLDLVYLTSWFMTSKLLLIVDDSYSSSPLCGVSLDHINAISAPGCLTYSLYSFWHPELFDGWTNHDA